MHTSLRNSNQLGNIFFKFVHLKTFIKFHSKKKINKNGHYYFSIYFDTYMAMD